MRKTLRQGFSLVGIAVMWIPVFQCNTIVILSESKLNCLMLSKGTVDLYNIVTRSQPLLSSHLTVYVDYMYPTMEVIFGQI